MAHRILILNDTELADLQGLLDYLLDAEVDYFLTLADDNALSPAPEVPEPVYTAAREEFEQNPNDTGAQDNLALVTEGSLFCGAMRLWKKIQ